MAQQLRVSVAFLYTEAHDHLKRWSPGNLSLLLASRDTQMVHRLHAGKSPVHLTVARLGGTHLTS